MQVCEKNTVFTIWMGYIFMTPVTSIADSCLPSTRLLPDVFTQRPYFGFQPF